MANRKSKFELSSIASVFTKEKLIWCRDKIENGRGPMQSALKTLHSQTTVIVYEIHQWYKYFEFTLRPCSSQLFRNSTSASPIHWQWNGKCKALGKCFSIASVVILSSRLFFFLHRIIVVTAQTVFVNVFRLNLMCFSFLIQLQGWEFSAWLIPLVRGTCLARARPFSWARSPLMVAITNVAGRVCLRGRWYIFYTKPSRTSLTFRFRQALMGVHITSWI